MLQIKHECILTNIQSNGLVNMQCQSLSESQGLVIRHREKYQEMTALNNVVNQSELRRWNKKIPSYFHGWEVISRSEHLT